MGNKYTSLLPEALNFWYCRALDAEGRERELRKENTELHERLNRENESANKHFMDSKKKDVEIAELKAALVNAGKENKELKDKLSISDFWKNAASNLHEELDRVEKIAVTLQKRYDDAIEIGLGYMNQCEKAQSEVEGLKSTVKRMGERITTLSDDLHLALHRLEYNNGLVDKMGKEKQYLLGELSKLEETEQLLELANKNFRDTVVNNTALQETVGRYAAECSRLNSELVKARQAASPWVVTCGSFST